MPSGSAQPVAGGRTSSQASALAAIARCDSTTPFGRPVVPEVSTTMAGASGPVSGGDGAGGKRGEHAAIHDDRRVEHAPGPSRAPGS